MDRTYDIQLLRIEGREIIPRLCKLPGARELTSRGSSGIEHAWMLFATEPENPANDFGAFVSAHRRVATRGALLEDRMVSPTAEILYEGSGEYKSTGWIGEEFSRLGCNRKECAYASGSDRSLYTVLLVAEDALPEMLERFNTTRR